MTHDETPRIVTKSHGYFSYPYEYMLSGNMGYIEDGTPYAYTIGSPCHIRRVWSGKPEGVA